MDLGQWIMLEGPLPPEQAVGWALRLVKTIEGLHRSGVTHGGITPEVVETIDRDCSAPAELMHADQAEADPQYFSAERARGKPASPQDDVWAVGVFLYYLVTKAMPFAGDRAEDVASRIEWRPASPIEVYDVEAPDVQGVLDQVFAPEPADRMTSAATLRRALAHCQGGDDDLPSLRLSESLRKTLVAVADAKPDRSTERRAEPSPRAAAAPARAAVVATADEPAAREPVAAPRAAPTQSRTSSGWDLAPWLLLVAILAVVVLIVTRDGHSPERPGAIAPVGPAPALAPQPSAPPATTASALPIVADMRSASAAPATSDRPAPPVTASATHRAAPSASSSAAASLVPAEDLGSCVTQMFPEGTFEDLDPGFEFICETAEAYKGAEVVRNRVVWARQGRLLTEAMREWSQLGWYDMAAFAVIQARCCQTAPALRAPVFIATCQIDEALAAVSAAAKKRNRRALDAALERYTIAVRCAANSGAGAYFGHDDTPTRAGRAMLDRLLKRLGSPR